MLKQLLPLLNGDALTVTGKTMAENVEAAAISNPEIIHSLDNPLFTEGGLSILRGNLAPDGAVIKHAAATPELTRHRGPAIVFKDVADLKARIHDPALDVTPDHVLVLQNAGPVGGPGMPEVGNLPIPQKLLKQGVRDMVRISDARMSGTSYGAIVLHVVAGKRAGRSAGAGARRRHHRAQRAGAPPALAGQRRGIGAPPGRVGCAAAGIPTRLWADVPAACQSSAAGMRL